jgi:hypothetical protein
MSRVSLQYSVNPKPLKVGIAEEHPRQLVYKKSNIYKTL